MTQKLKIIKQKKPTGFPIGLNFFLKNKKRLDTSFKSQSLVELLFLHFVRPPFNESSE